MRLSHHLVRARSGIYSFRLRVPKPLQGILGIKVVKRSLHTRDAPCARACAHLLALRYAQAFAVLRGVQVAKVPSLDEVLASLSAPSGARPFEASFDPVSRALTHIRTDGTPEDNAAALAFAQTVLAQAVPGPPAALASAASPNGAVMLLGEAMKLYRQTQLADTPQTTRRHWERAFNTFEQHIGSDKPVAVITRPMAAQWADGLMASGNTKRTAARAVSQVAQVFEWLAARGEVSANPVKGVLVVTLREKVARRDQGFTWEPFELADLKRIFDPENYRRLKSEHAYWGPLIGLYTGARVGEIAQLYLRDFTIEDGQPCIRIDADSDGQSVKTQTSKRLVPIHPDLVQLGLVERVERLRAKGEERLFPKMRIDSKAGAGNSMSKAFSYYLSKLGIRPRRKNGTVGFHSLRKNVIQQLQGSSLPAERRRALVGHEPGEGGRGDVHALFYERKWTPQELAALFPGLAWGEWLDVRKIGAVGKLSGD